MKDLVSVVVPAYNHENYIEECIDSIINQSYDNIELIIINDGSSDRTADIIESKAEECKRRFNRFLFIDKENEGVAKTLNIGCFRSKGEFIAIGASDDTFTKNAIEILYGFLKNNTEYVLAVGNNFFIDDQSERCFWDSNCKKTYNLKKAESDSFVSFLRRGREDVNFFSDDFGSYKTLLKGNYIPNGYLIRKDIFINKVNGYIEKDLLEDYCLHLQLSKHGKYKYIDKHLYNYRWHSANTVKQREKMLQLTIDTLELEKDYSLKLGLKKNLEEYILIYKNEQKKYKLKKIKKLAHFLKEIYLKSRKLILIIKSCFIRLFIYLKKKLFIFLKRF